jgi:hypothetical protein
MLIPSPTQPPSLPERSNDKVTPRRRSGPSPTARFLKAIFRPILKSLYYVLRFMGGHKIVTLLAIVLLLASGIFTSYLVTKQGPFGIGSDQFQLHVNGKAVAGGEKIQNWLYHLRQGNVTDLQVDDKNISQPPDATQYVSQFSEPKANLVWKGITVLGSYGQADTTVDTFVTVDVSTRGPGGASTSIFIFHFVTVSQGSSGTLFDAAATAVRPLQ